MFDRTLFVMVSCSLETTRGEVFCKVVDNLCACNARTEFFDKFILFDNASTDEAAIAAMHKLPLVVRADRNVGYWSAVDWCLRNAERILGREFDFLYIIESDLTHFNFWRLSIAEDFLASYADVGSVRTQKFSVRFRAFYSKTNVLSRLTHDAVNLTSYPSGEPARFSKCPTHKGIFVSNIHGKLVGLNRLSAIKDIFNALSQKESFEESGYFIEYAKRFSKTGILDGGIATEKLASRRQFKKVVVSSHLGKGTADSSGYFGTRKGSIRRSGFNVTRFV